MTPLETQIVAGFAALALAVTSTVGAALVNWILKHVKLSDIARAQAIAHVVVPAVEQIASTTNWPNPQKFEVALGQAKSQAKRFGVNLSDAQWRSFIEAEVLELKHLGAMLVPAVPVVDPPPPSQAPTPPAPPQPDPMANLTPPPPEPENVTGGLNVSGVGMDS